MGEKSFLVIVHGDRGEDFFPHEDIDGELFPDGEFLIVISTMRYADQWPDLMCGFLSGLTQYGLHRILSRPLIRNDGSCNMTRYLEMDLITGQ